MSWTDGRKFPTLDSASTTKRLTNYIVLVAGGCSGIGRATVERFANDGAIVYALDIRVQGVKEFQESFGSQVSCVQLDVSDSDLCKQVVAGIAEKHNSTIHTLVNCVAYFGSKGLDATPSDWTKSLDVNIVGYSNMVQAVEPFMHKATKGAILTVTRCMALDLRAKQIRVNSVSPGYIWTPEGAKAAGNERAVGETMCHGFFILDRQGEVEEVAAVITFLASRDASYITGADIPVTGGYLALGPEQTGAQSSFAGVNY